MRTKIFRKISMIIFLSASFLYSKAQQVTGNSLQQADSLYYAGNYKMAKTMYEKLLPDTSTDALHIYRMGFSFYSLGNNAMAEKYFGRSLSFNPQPPLKGMLLSRLARTSALKNKQKEAIDYLDSAVNAGYLAIGEIDTVKDFSGIRQNQKFKEVRNRLYNQLYPCMNDPHAREFDFWIGQWDVYVTGSNRYAGNSAIEKISGGCAILENWKSTASEGKSLNFIDDSTHKWKQVWVGSYANGKQDFVNGEYKDSAMRFSFETNDAQGNKILGRFTFFNEGASQVRQLNETSTDGGSTWVVGYDFTYKRKK
jgi:tetratricopeptide (TPR) repeat protein